MFLCTEGYNLMQNHYFLIIRELLFEGPTVIIIIIILFALYVLKRFEIRFFKYNFAKSL